jgi:drug/metabolite transporter (DMT)-like permease
MGGVKFYDRAVPLLTLAILFWSLNFVLGRAVRADIPAGGLAFWRWAVATLLLAPSAWPQVRRDWPTIRTAWAPLLLLAFLGVTVFNTLIYLGLQTTVALNAFLLQSLMPVLIVGLSFVIFRERVHRRQLLGLSVSLMGAAWVIARGDVDALASLQLAFGDVLVFVAVICYAAYSVLLRLRPKIGPLAFLFVTFAPGTLMLLPFYVWETVAVAPVRITVVSVASIAYVAVFPSIVSFLFFNRGVELAGANRAGTYLHLMPLFGAVFSIVLLGEALRPFHFVGAALIGTGILLAGGFRRARPSTGPVPPD